MERNFLDKRYAPRKYFAMTEREYLALNQLLSYAEDRHRKDLRVKGFTTKYLNAAINKFKNARAI